MPERPLQSPIAIKLAERYGVTPDAMEAIISATGHEYSPAPSANLPPSEHAPEAPIEHAASMLASSEISSLLNENNPTAPMPAPIVIHETKPLGSGVLTAIFTLLLIALGIALSFQRGCFRQRRLSEITKPVDTIQSLLSQQAQKASTPPQNPTQVSPEQVPPEALVVPREEPPGTSGTPSNSGIMSEAEAEKASGISSPKPVLQTSSNFEAEERLAELRAGGFAKARIKAMHKGGGTVYRIYRK